MIHWLYIHAGLGQDVWNRFWSGIGSDIGEVAIPAAMVGWYYKHNCHLKKCYRIGRHTVDGTPWCNKHHKSARDNG